MNLEQKIALREYYESELAHSVLRNPATVPAVKIVSQSIVELIDANINSIQIDLTKESIAIQDEMEHPDYFGRLNVNKDLCTTPMQTLKDLRDILTNDQSPLELIMHVHAIFMQRVYDKLPNQIPTCIYYSQSDQCPSYSQQIAEQIRNAPEKVNEMKSEVVKKIFHNELFYKNNKIDRSRQVKSQEIARSNLIGISRSEFFMEKSEKSGYEHLRAADRFVGDASSNYTQQAMKLNLPVVAGPSGNAGGLMLGAVMLGNLSQEEMKQYGLASAAYLIGGGNHAFHEVGSVLAKVGIEHKMGDYMMCLPHSYKNSKAYQEVKNKFAKLLKDNIYQKIDLDESFNVTEYESFYQQLTSNSLELNHRNHANNACINLWEKFEAIGNSGNQQIQMNTCKTKEIMNDHSKDASSYLSLSASVAASLSGSEKQQPLLMTSSGSNTKFTSAQIPSGMLDLFLFGAAKLGLYDYPKTGTAEVKITNSPTVVANGNNKQEENDIANEVLTSLCGHKYTKRYPEKAELVKNMIKDILDKRVSPAIGRAYNAIEGQEHNQHIRWKKLVKLAHVNDEYQTQRATQVRRP